MKTIRKPSVLTGALVGLLLTAPAVALFYLADQLAGLPFVPFDVFDWVGRIRALGGTITFTIDTMISTIRTFNLGEISSTAKTIEHILGISGFLVTGMIVGGVLFYILSRRKDYKPNYIPGLIVGLVVGIPVMLISDQLNFTATANPLVSAIWILAVFLAWGVAFNWVYDDLVEAGATAVDAISEISLVQLNRRQFIVRVGGVAATLTVVGTGLAALLGRTEPSIAVSIAEESPTDAAQETDGEGNPLPNANASVQPAPGTRPEYTPLEKHYRVDIDSRPPEIDGTTWTLTIKGLVDNPMVLTLDDLRNNYEPMDQYITLSCISNPLGGGLIGTTRWTGVSLQKILDQVNPKGAYLRMTSADGFDEVLDLRLAKMDERVMLTYEWDGEPLRPGHGYPARIYIPDRYGMKQPKWIVEMEVVDQFEEGFWVRRGWSQAAIMRATSVIDTVAVDSAIKRGSNFLIPIGGIAHAGARSISKVEVKIDDGDWVEAQLRTPLSDTTWVIWRYDWPFVEGDHKFAVRCYDGKGVEQIENVNSSRPNGATGIYSVRKSINQPEQSSA